MFELFKAKAEAVGAEVIRLGTKEEGIRYLLTLLDKEGVAEAVGRYAVWAPGPLLDSDQAAALRNLPALKPAATREVAAQARIGISQLDWGLADTGTLVQDQTEISQRLASSLPEIHVALLDTAAILSDKVALLKRIDPVTSRYLAFITGPSRTADIERVLTIGVHGPKRLVVLLIDGLGGRR